MKSNNWPPVICTRILSVLFLDTEGPRRSRAVTDMSLLQWFNYNCLTHHCKNNQNWKMSLYIIKNLDPISYMSFYCVHNQEISFRFDILVFCGNIHVHEGDLFFFARWNPFELNIAVFEFFRFDLAINFDYLEKLHCQRALRFLAFLYDE